MDLSIPIYQQIADILRERISSGEYVIGDKLPSEKLLSTTYGVNHLTIRKALALLEQEEMIRRVQGKGTFVKMHHVAMDMQDIESFSSFLEKKMLVSKNKVLFRGFRKAGIKYSQIFAINENDDVYLYNRLRYGNDVPLAIEHNVIPKQYFTDIDEVDFNVMSLRDWYVKNNIKVTSEHQILEVITASKSQARLLNIEENTAIFLLSSYAFDQYGRVVEYCQLFSSDDRIVYYTQTKGKD